MERRLIIMRHARSSAGDAHTPDHARPLTERGEEQAQEIATRLVELGWTPQLVISSDATRTRQTWQAMAPSFQPPPEVTWDNSLYLAGIDAIEGALWSADDRITDVLLLGHNPGWQDSISYFAGCQERMSTANAALLHCSSDDWPQAAQSGNFSLVQVLRPSHG